MSLLIKALKQAERSHGSARAADDGIAGARAREADGDQARGLQAPDPRAAAAATKTPDADVPAMVSAPVLPARSLALEEVGPGAPEYGRPAGPSREPPAQQDRRTDEPDGPDWSIALLIPEPPVDPPRAGQDDTGPQTAVAGPPVAREIAPDERRDVQRPAPIDFHPDHAPPDLARARDRSDPRHGRTDKEFAPGPAPDRGTGIDHDPPAGNGGSAVAEPAEPIDRIAVHAPATRARAGLSRSSLGLLLIAGLLGSGYLALPWLAPALSPAQVPNHPAPTMPMPMPGPMDGASSSAADDIDEAPAETRPVGPRLEPHDIAALAAAAPLDRMTAEGGWDAVEAAPVATIADVLAAPANPPGNPPRRDRPTLARATAPTVRETPGDTSGVVARPVAQAPAPVASASPRRATNPSQTDGVPEDSTALRPDAGPAGAPEPTARDAPPSEPGPSVRFRRILSKTERAALVKEAAYRALRENRPIEAEDLYRDALVRDPLDVDAWVGLASVAAMRGDPDLARQQYERALAIDPNDAVARAGLLSVTRSDDPVTRESRLRDLIASGLNTPSVVFELATALADQGRWIEAQQAYFEASNGAPDNADYAFSLAVALERIRQPQAAAQHYARALSLAQTGGASFDTAMAHGRIAAIGQAGSR